MENVIFYPAILENGYSPRKHSVIVIKHIPTQLKGAPISERIFSVFYTVSC